MAWATLDGKHVFDDEPMFSNVEVQVGDQIVTICQPGRGYGGEPEVIGSRPVRPTNNAESPYLAPNLNDLLAGDDSAEVNHARMGMRYDGDPAADNRQRMGIDVELLDHEPMPVMNANGEMPYVWEGFQTNVAPPQRRPQTKANYGGSGGGGGRHVEQPYAAPKLTF
ncbi:hypothetical protein [Lacipirellula sp.]|uniref:hypothetical protein n=1 Tax=Lacipirellula sp. TaxID=2691419 RepID=UPI003D0A0B5C